MLGRENKIENTSDIGKYVYVWRVYVFIKKNWGFWEPNAGVNTLIAIIGYNINEDMHGSNNYRG